MLELSTRQRQNNMNLKSTSLYFRIRHQLMEALGEVIEYGACAARGFIMFSIVPWIFEDRVKF
jgi:hypothetical protein